MSMVEKETPALPQLTFTFTVDRKANVIQLLRTTSSGTTQFLSGIPLRPDTRLDGVFNGTTLEKVLRDLLPPNTRQGAGLRGVLGTRVTRINPAPPLLPLGQYLGDLLLDGLPYADLQRWENQRCEVRIVLPAEQDAALPDFLHSIPWMLLAPGATYACLRHSLRVMTAPSRAAIWVREPAVVVFGLLRDPHLDTFEDELKHLERIWWQPSRPSSAPGASTRSSGTPSASGGRLSFWTGPGLPPAPVALLCYIGRAARVGQKPGLELEGNPPGVVSVEALRAHLLATGGQVQLLHLQLEHMPDPYWMAEALHLLDEVVPVVTWACELRKVVPEPLSPKVHPLIRYLTLLVRLELPPSLALATAWLTGAHTRRLSNEALDRLRVRWGCRGRYLHWRLSTPTQAQALPTRLLLELDRKSQIDECARHIGLGYRHARRGLGFIWAGGPGQEPFHLHERIVSILRQFWVPAEQPSAERGEVLVLEVRPPHRTLTQDGLRDGLAHALMLPRRAWSKKEVQAWQDHSIQTLRADRLAVYLHLTLDLETLPDEGWLKLLTQFWIDEVFGWAQPNVMLVCAVALELCGQSSAHAKDLKLGLARLEQQARALAPMPTRAGAYGVTILKPLERVSREDLSDFFQRFGVPEQYDGNEESLVEDLLRLQGGFNPQYADWGMVKDFLLQFVECWSVPEHLEDDLDEP